MRKETPESGQEPQDERTERADGVPLARAVPQKKRGPVRSCLGIGCLIVLLAIVIAIILAYVGGTTTTVRTGGERAPTVTVTRNAATL